MSINTAATRKIIPVFFAVDDKYAPYLAVAVRSLIDNASKDYDYSINILINELSDEHRNALSAMQTENTKIDFVNVRKKLDSFGGILHLRDYYTQATYYRFFIPDLFPEFDKGIYLDCDMIMEGDISELFNIELGNLLLAAGPEEVMLEVDIFGRYVERVLGVPREEYFSAGVILMNLAEMRRIHIETEFVELLGKRTFRVTQDQDYLNVIAYKKNLLLGAEWNKTAFPNAVDDSPKIIHFKINWKPWHYKGTRFEEYFWKYAEKTPYLEKLLETREGFTEEDAAREARQYEALVQLAVDAIANDSIVPEKDASCEENKSEKSEDSSKNAQTTLAPDRVAVLEKIAEYERLGYFDRDVENDPPTTPLTPGTVDYTGKKLSSRVASKVANMVAKHYFEGLIKKGHLVIKEIRGIENFLSVKNKGAVITSNHFNAYDNYAIFKAVEPHLGKNNLYKIIREGNYTSYSGLYGYFFRHCNTLPLGSHHAVIRELSEGVQELLKKGEKILIYPEQGMWWNYKKPRPLKIGAFRFAVKAGVPVVPMFITTEETDNIGEDGFPILAYTVHILPAIFPTPEMNLRENALAMCRENYKLWKETYEEFYKTELVYTTEGDVEPCSI